MTTLRPLAVLLGVILLASCDKNAAQNISGPTAGSAVKFFNFGIGDPSVNFYADTTKLSAVSSTACSSPVDGTTKDTVCLTRGNEATTGTAYGVAAIGGGLYASIAPGTHVISGRISTATDNGIAISNTSTTFESGKFYSYYLSGLYLTANKTADAFVVEDPLPAIDFTVAYVRFVNASGNSQPMALYAKDQVSGVTLPVGSTVAYKAAGAFVAIPNGIYDLSTRLAGSSTSVISRTGVSFSAGRVYTVSAYGDITVTTGATKASLDNTTNR